MRGQPHQLLRLRAGFRIDDHRYGILVLRHRYQGATISRPEDLVGLFPSAVTVHVPLLGAGRSRPARHVLLEVGLAAYVVVLLGASVFLLAAHKGWVASPEWLQGLFPSGGGRA